MRVRGGIHEGRGEYEILSKPIFAAFPEINSPDQRRRISISTMPVHGCLNPLTTLASHKFSTDVVKANAIFLACACEKSRKKRIRKQTTPGQEEKLRYKVLNKR